MHVGHIRSTVLGDALARDAAAARPRVITDNHIGDWGTQFGKLLVGWKQHLDRAALERDAIARNGAALQDRSMPRAKPIRRCWKQARQELVKLQGGDAENLAIWREMIALSRKAVRHDLSRLRREVRSHARRKFLQSAAASAWCRNCATSGIARESEGRAFAVFFDDRSFPQDGEWSPIPPSSSKSDGGFNYTTTDLATLQYRLETWPPDEIVYVTEAGSNCISNNSSPPSAAGSRRPTCEAGPRLVRLDSRRRRQAVQDAQSATP